MDRQAAWIVVYELRADPAPIPPGVDPGSVRECCAGRFWAVIDSRN
jgi:hypothetical protein